MKPGMVGRVRKAWAAGVKRVYTGTLHGGSRMGTYAAGSGHSVVHNFTRLRESAIEPLPQRERLPVDLRELDWDGKKPRPDAGAMVRRLRGRVKDAKDHNELGCAYALLAWETSRSAYWLDAIRHLREAAKDDDQELAKLATKNLERVAAASKYGIDS